MLFPPLPPHSNSSFKTKGRASPSWGLPVLLKTNHALYLEKVKTLIQRDTGTPMFTAALFTTAKTWKQPKCPSTDEWIKKMWYIYLYNGILLSHKKEWNYAICSNMDGPRDYHTKWSKSDRGRQIAYDITFMWNL